VFKIKEYQNGYSAVVVLLNYIPSRSVLYTVILTLPFLLKKRNINPGHTWPPINHPHPILVDRQKKWCVKTHHRIK